MIISEITIPAGSNTGASASVTPPAAAHQNWFGRRAGACLDAEAPEQDQRETENSRDAGADAQSIAQHGRRAVGNRYRAAPDIDRQHAFAFSGEGRIHRLRHRGSLRDRLRARRRAYAHARMAHPGLVRERFQARIRADALFGSLEGTSNAGVVAFRRGGEIDVRRHALRCPGRHEIAHLPEQPGRQQRAYAEDYASDGWTRQRCRAHHSRAYPLKSRLLSP
jgi:hypothetical protein